MIHLSTVRGICKKSVGETSEIHETFKMFIKNALNALQSRSMIDVYSQKMRMCSALWEFRLTIGEMDDDLELASAIYVRKVWRRPIRCFPSGDVLCASVDCPSVWMADSEYFNAAFGRIRLIPDAVKERRTPRQRKQDVSADLCSL